jgi:hypothetical protein
MWWVINKGSTHNSSSPVASQAMRHLLSPFPVVVVSIKNNKKLHSSNILARNVVAVEVKALAKPLSWPN